MNSERRVSVVFSTVARSQRAAWALALLPVLSALPFVTDADTSSGGAWLNLLGRLTGILGLSCLLVAAMLCCRVPGLDRPFGGLTKLWQLHHKLGASGFMLILMHPVLLSLGAVEVSLDAALTTLFSASAALLWGWIALLVLMLFMAPSFAFFGEPEYQRWKWLHRLSGITVVLALVHTFMLARSLPGLPGQLVWIFFALLALAAISWRWVFSRSHGRKRYRVSALEHPANNVVELTLVPLHGPLLHYEPGQFVYLSPHDPGLAVGQDEEHPYTLSSAPHEPVLRIAIKALGDASHALQSIQVGTEASIEGPYGAFFPAAAGNPEPELWIDGGIGVTPFLARLRHAVRHEPNLRVHLIHCVQDENRCLYGDELASLIGQLPGSALHVHYFYRNGPLDLAFLSSHCPDFASRTVYACGPAPLLTLTQQLLRAAGVPGKRIITEEFNLL